MFKNLKPYIWLARYTYKYLDITIKNHNNGWNSQFGERQFFVEIVKNIFCSLLF